MARGERAREREREGGRGTPHSPNTLHHITTERVNYCNYGGRGGDTREREREDITPVWGGGGEGRTKRERERRAERERERERERAPGAAAVMKGHGVGIHQ